MKKSVVIELSNNGNYCIDCYITCRKEAIFGSQFVITGHSDMVKILPENGSPIEFNLEHLIDAINELADDFEIVKKEKTNDA